MNFVFWTVSLLLLARFTTQTISPRTGGCLIGSAAEAVEAVNEAYEQYLLYDPKVEPAWIEEQKPITIGQLDRVQDEASLLAVLLQLFKLYSRDLGINYDRKQNHFRTWIDLIDLSVYYAEAHVQSSPTAELLYPKTLPRIFPVFGIIFRNALASNPLLLGLLQGIRSRFNLSLYKDLDDNPAALNNYMASMVNSFPFVLCEFVDAYPHLAKKFLNAQ